MDKASTGRIVIELLPNRDTEDGFKIDYERNEWGRIVSIGDPAPDLFSTPQIILHKITGIHPGPWKEGDMVLIPTIRREFEGYNGRTRSIIFQGDVSAFRKSGSGYTGPSLRGFWRFLRGQFRRASAAFIDLRNCIGRA